MSTPRRLALRSIGTPMIRIFSGILAFFQRPGRQVVLSRSIKPVILSRSRINAIEHPWEGDDLANVLSPANPSDRALEAKAEAGMRHAAVAAQVQIPLKGFLGQIVLAEALDEGFITREALAAADNLAVAFRGDHVETQRKLGPLGVGGHVKRFHRCRVAVDYHGLVEFFRNDRFFIATEIVAPLRWVAGLLQYSDGIVVADAREGRLDFFELRDVAFEHGKFARAIFYDRLYHRADESLAELHHVFKVRVGGFGLEHPEFGKVAARF